MNRIQAGCVIGVGLLALGPTMGFVMGPCFSRFEGGVDCYLGGILLTDAESFLLTWGLVILGIGILVMGLLMGHRTPV